MAKKIICLLLIISLWQMDVKGFAQDAIVSIQMDNISLEQLLAEIEKQTDVRFLYRYENIAGKKTTIHAEKTAVSIVLDEALKSNGLRYTVQDNNLIVVAPEILAAQQTVNQQVRNISGRITDAEEGEPIPGVSVFFTNTTVGTSTDAEGRYRLRIPGEGSYRLTVSHVSYQSVVKDIEPGSASVVFDAVLQTQELEEVKVSAGIRFRQRDITLFWSNILGKNPSRRTIQATNPETVYYYYNPESKILKVLCREPLEIINYETGYRIQYLLDYFTHDYNTNITNWEYQSIFQELEPDNNRQKDAWEKKRKEVYQVSIAKFIKSLYNNTLLNDGFVLTPLRSPGQYDPAPGRADPFRQTSIINPDDILTTNPADNSKLLNLINAQILLLSYGRPVNEYDIANIPYLQNGGLIKGVRRWEEEYKDVYVNQLHGERIRIYPDGTYTNRIFLSPKDVSNPLLIGLCMTLPIDYQPEATLISSAPENKNTRLPAYDFDNINERFVMQLSEYPQEKIHLHTDRNFYVPGEKIWFKAYVTDAQSHRNATNSFYVYVELISPEDTLVNRVMVTQIDGMFYGYLPVSDKIPEGNYTLRAYTRYMENLGDDYFFKKNIRIAGINNHELRITNYEKIKEGKGDFEITFFPEGGNLPEGVLCKVAIKALNQNGLPETVTGTVIDNTGAAIATVHTGYAGMGVFDFKPEAGKQYRLKCTNESGLEKLFELPRSNPRAYTLAVSPDDENNLCIEVKHSVKAPNIPCYLLVHCRGDVIHFSEWNSGDDEFLFEQKELPAGVIQFLLLDRQMNPLSERLVFSKNDTSAAVEFRTDKTAYGIREKVTVTLSLTPSLLGRAGERCLSVAITDNKDIKIDESTTILSSLLLSSELKGYIENPAFYLQDDDAMDLLMMTHGWRRYNIPDVVKGRLERPKISFQEYQHISGQVKSLIRSKPVADSEILVLMKDGGGVGVTSTDKNGLFVVQNLDFPDSTTFYIRAVNKNGRDDVKLFIDEVSFPKLVYAPQSPFSRQQAKDTETIDEPDDKNVFIVKAEQRIKFDEDIWTQYLDEVVVTARKIEKKDTPRLQNWINTSSDQTITRDDIEKYHMNNVSVGEAIAMLEPSAVVKINSAGVRTVTLRGGALRANENNEDKATDKEKVDDARAAGSALLVIDGIVRENDDSAWRISMNEVESIDIFKGASAVVFGMRGAYGVISLTTKRGTNTSFTQKDNNTTFTPLGYQKPVEFYAPKYETLAARQSPVPDYRTTIFWKPDIVLSDDGEVSFEFYSSDYPTTYSVVIEGLTNDGKIVRQVEKITVDY